MKDPVGMKFCINIDGPIETNDEWLHSAYRQRLVLLKRIDSIVAIKRNLYDNTAIKTFRYTELCKNWQQPWIFVKFVRQQFGFKRPFT